MKMMEIRKNKNKIFYIEITTKCNLKCPFCPSSDQNHNQFMEESVFQTIIHQIKDDAQLIYLHVLGEPTLHPKFRRFLDIVSEKKIPIGITTNGTTLDQIDEDILRHIPIQKMNISLQCLISFHEEHIQHYLKHLKLFLERKEKYQPKLAINLRLWNDKSNPKVCLLNQRLKEEFAKWDIARYTYVRIAEADDFEWPTLTDKVVQSSNCLGGKKQLAILHDGRVVLCCLDYQGFTCIGNILIQPYKEIIASHLYQKAIEGFCSQKPYFELCKGCSYRSRFKN